MAPIQQRMMSAVDCATVAVSSNAAFFEISDAGSLRTALTSFLFASKSPPVEENAP